jgi:hypothetical protein
MAQIGNTAGNAITTKVVGGIGNQLFCYFAGYYLAKKLRCELNVDVSDIRNKRSVHDVSIEALELPGTFFANSSSSVQHLANRISNKINRTLPILRISKNTFISNEIGFDPLLEKIELPTSIQGYFQSYKYFLSFPYSEIGIRLKDPSPWYLQIEKTLSDKQFTSLHIRRGDYLSYSNSYGLLSAQYYKDAIKTLAQKDGLHQVHVFSDDIDAAREILELIVPADTVWISPPLESNPVESLMLMSLASSNIIANSTYSWWGATLNKEKSAVIAPKKWFRSMPDPEFLYPPEWQLIESHWEV